MTAFDPTSVTHDMARFALGLDWASLPEAVRREAPRAWMNWVACAVGAARTPVMDAAVRGIQAMEQAGEAGLLGRGESASVSNAALLNCLGSSAQTYGRYTSGHHHAPDRTGCRGCVGRGLQAGFDGRARVRPRPADRAGGRVGTRMPRELRDRRGWQPAGLVHDWPVRWHRGSRGCRTAAQSGSRPIGLGAGLGRDASRRPSCHARQHGDHLCAGMAARNGVAAAYMASAGFDCGSIAVDGRNGLLQVLTGATDAGRSA